MEEQIMDSIDLVRIPTLIEKDRWKQKITLYHLNYFHKAAMAAGKATENQSPYQWSRKEGAQIVREIADTLSGPINTSKVLRSFRSSKPGAPRGTYGSEDVVYAYAMYLSPAFQLEVIKVFKRHVANTRLRGTPWLEKRAEGKGKRRDFTDALQARGVRGPEFGMITNEGYRGLLGADANTLKAERGLRPKDSLRDHMSEIELIAQSLQEAVTATEAREELLIDPRQIGRKHRANGEKIAAAVDLSKHKRLRG